MKFKSESPDGCEAESADVKNYSIWQWHPVQRNNTPFGNRLHGQVGESPREEDEDLQVSKKKAAIAVLPCL